MSSISSSSSRAAWIIGALVTTLTAVGCAPQQTCPSVTTAAGPHAASQDRHIYRFDFVVTTIDGSGAAPVPSSFTMTLQEHDKGEMHVGKNVSLAPPPSPSGAPSSGSSPRQDVGLKVVANFHMAGEEPLMDVGLEMSSFDPPTSIRKVVSKSEALVAVGKPVLVTSLDDDHKRHQLTVTATRIH